MSVSRFLTNLQQNERDSLKAEIITHILKHGSLFKHEIHSLMKNQHSKVVVENQI